MFDFNSTVDYEDPEVIAIIEVKNSFYVVQCIGLVIELVFIFVMIRNWCRKITTLRSAFFYLTTLKIVNDFFYMLYVVVISYCYDQLMDFYIATGFLYFSFCAEVDILCQLVIVANRFTALMMTLKHDHVCFVTFLKISK